MRQSHNFKIRPELTGNIKARWLVDETTGGEYEIGQYIGGDYDGYLYAGDPSDPFVIGKTEKDLVWEATLKTT
jgi:hypothetical protein